MIIRTAKVQDVARMIELVRASPTGAQWSNEQFAKMVTGEGARMMLVLEENAERLDATYEEQIPRSARNDKFNREGVENGRLSRQGLGSEDFKCEGIRSGGIDPNVRVEGFAVAHRIGSECEVENVVVNPESRRRGFGELLLRELMKWVQQAGCETVFLEVRDSNRAARGLYEKCGFREVGRRVKYYAQPTEDAVVYRFSWGDVASKTVQT